MRGTKFANSPSGWVNSDAFIQWFLKHFRPQILKRPLVLLYDGHLQFISVRVLERAREDGVLLFPLPPHPAYNHCIENTCFHAFHVSAYYLSSHTASAFNTVDNSETYNYSGESLCALSICK